MTAYLRGAAQNRKGEPVDEVQGSALEGRMDGKPLEPGEPYRFRTYAAQLARKIPVADPRVGDVLVVTFEGEPVGLAVAA